MLAAPAPTDRAGIWHGFILPAITCGDAGGMVSAAEREASEQGTAAGRDLTSRRLTFGDLARGLWCGDQ